VHDIGALGIVVNRAQTLIFDPFPGTIRRRLRDAAALPTSKRFDE
jgi:hypothetical protein